MKLNFYKSIRMKMLMTIILLVIITGYVLTGYTIYQIRDNMLNIIQSDIIAITDEASSHVSNVLLNYMQTLEAYTLSEDIQSMDYERQRTFLEELRNPFFQGITIIDLDGLGQFNGSSIYLGDREYYKIALNGESYISNMLHSRFIDENVIILSTPIYRDNEIVGVITGRILGSAINDIIEEKDLDQKGYSYVIDDKGCFVSYKIEEIVQQDYTISDIVTDYPKLDPFLKFYEDTKDNKEGYGSYIIDNKKIIAAYHVIESTGWTLYSAVQEDVLLADMNKTVKQYIVAAALIFLLSIILASELSKRITNPLIKLSHTFEAVQMGDFNVRSDMNRKDEIGILSDGFNRLMNKVNALTFFDDTTGFPNLLALDNHLDNLNSSETISLLSIGIQDFKRINEYFGFDVGDQLLIAIGERLSKIVSVDEKVYRGKGDNFFILLKGDITTYADVRLTKIMSLLSSVFRIQHYTIHLLYHIGIIKCDEKPGPDVLAKVNLAYMHARRSEKVFEIYNDQLLKMTKDETELELDLLKAIENHDFYMVYQPIINLSNGELVDCEALIRWQHKVRGYVSPELFIQKAENLNKIREIDYWVIDCVCQQIAALQSNVVFSVNVSSKTFEDADFLYKMLVMTKRHGIQPNLLQVELTERVILKDVQQSIKIMNALRAEGFRIALDDFGIGYSSLSYLVQLPLDVVKIDRSFIMHMHNKKESKSIVNAIISMCHEINVSVVAEGIETKQDQEYLKARACDYGQGYYFDKPISLDEIMMKYNLKKAGM